MWGVLPPLLSISLTVTSSSSNELRKYMVLIVCTRLQEQRSRTWAFPLANFLRTFASLWNNSLRFEIIRFDSKLFVQNNYSLRIRFEENDHYSHTPKENPTARLPHDVSMAIESMSTSALVPCGSIALDIIILGLWMSLKIRLFPSRTLRATHVYYSTWTFDLRVQHTLASLICVNMKWSLQGYIWYQCSGMW